MALGCLEALAEIGLRVPDDVSLAGFDDSLVARTCVPQLTTVRQPLRAMGARAVEQLLALVGDDKHPPRTPATQPIIFPVELVLRSSVTPPPPASRLVPPPRR